MKYAYPAIFHPEKNGGYSVIFPDIQMGGTCGDTLADAIFMAEDFLSLALLDYEETHNTIPEPTDVGDIKLEGNGDFVNIIAADAKAYRRVLESRLVKKTLNIPSWLNDKAEDAGLNFSQVLRKALEQELDEPNNDNKKEGHASA